MLSRSARVLISPPPMSTEPSGPQQPALFDATFTTDPASAPTLAAASRRPGAVTRGPGVQAVELPEPIHALARALPRQVRLGTSSWHFPGWAGLVWGGDYAESKLSKEGLLAYARHPLLTTVSLDRAFYRPLSASQYARYAAQVPPHFRFVVKAPALVCDALVRTEDGRGMAPNPAFLNIDLAVQEFIQPALDGLGGADELAGAAAARVFLAGLPVELARGG